MTKADEYRNKLSTLENWDVFLLRESGLPGPRGNLELAQVVADLGNQELFERYLGYDADQAPTNSPYEFLAFCGIVGLGAFSQKASRRCSRPCAGALLTAAGEFVKPSRWRSNGLAT